VERLSDNTGLVDSLQLGTWFVFSLQEIQKDEVHRWDAGEMVKATLEMLGLLPQRS
jgi:hypothetical protein